MLCLRFALCGLFLVTPAIGSVQSVADKIYYGGDVVTVDDTNPTAEAVAVGDGKIMKVGSLAEIVRLRGANTELIDLDDRTLVPGFIDAHGHLSRTGLQAVSANLLPPPQGPSTTIIGLLETLRLWLRQSRLPRASGLVMGFGYSETQFTQERTLTRDDLDAVSMALPVIAIHWSGDKSVFNSKALELAGIGPSTRNPYGGKIGRRSESDEPDGSLEKAAHRAALSKVLATLGKEEFRALIKAGEKIYVEFGHTTAQDGGPDAGALAAYPEIAAVGRLRIDVIAYPDLLRFGNDSMHHDKLHSRDYTNGYRIGGVMLRLYDAKRPETARLRDSYLRLTSGPVRRIASKRGLTDREAAALMTRAFRNGWHVQTSVGGDLAVDQFIRSVRAAAANAPGDSRRPSLILEQSLRPDQVADMRELRILPAFSPFHEVEESSADHAAPSVTQTAAMIPQVGFPRHGEMMFTAYHDAPAATPDPLRVVSETIERFARQGDAFENGIRVTRLSALKAVTLWAAYQHFEEHRKGSIEAGKLADLVILSGNPLTVDSSKIGTIKVLETIKEGHTIYLHDEKPRNSAQSSLACANSPNCTRGLSAALAGIGYDSTAPRNMASMDGRSGAH